MRIPLIFWREYWSNLTRRSYLIFTFGFPIFLIAIPILGGLALALAIRSALPPTDPRPIGVVDAADLLENGPPLPNGPVDIIVFDNAAAAAQAFESDQLQAIYTIQSDYWESGRVEMHYSTPPTERVDRMFTNWLHQYIQQQAPAAILRRIEQGPSIDHYGLSGQTGFSENDIIEPIMVYLILYFVRLAGSFTASYMFDSVASEADDRTLEIMLTSVTPLQFITGKVLGLLAVGLTQIGVWAGAILLIAIGASYILGVNLLEFLYDWEYLGLMVNILLATYLMDQILAAAMGLMRVSGGAGNLLFNTINSVVGISLIYAAYFVPRNPNSVLAVVASLFPLTSPLVLLIRVVVTEVPTWQIVVSLSLLWATIFGGLFLLRWLLKANLVANASPFSLRQWLQKQTVRLRTAAEQ